MSFKKIAALFGGLSLFLVVSFVMLPQHSFAVDVITDVCKNNPTGETPSVCKDNQSSATNADSPLFGKNGLGTKGIQIFVMIVGIISIFVLLINATRMIIGGSDPSSVNSARNGIIYAIIGLVIVASAQAVISFILNKV